MLNSDASKPKMFKWGVLGCASIAKKAIIPAICKSGNGELFAIASRDDEKARRWADIYGFEKAYGSYEALLGDPDVEGVYIPLATSMHVEWSLKALRAGKHVLCEKPISIQAEMIDELIKERDRCGLVISESFMVAYHPQWKVVRQWIDEGRIGRLRQVHGVFTYFNVDPTNTRNIVSSGGGGLLDIGVYPVVTTYLATGARANAVRADIDFDQTFGTDKFARVDSAWDGFDLSFYVATQLSLRQSMVFHGDKGVIEVVAPFNAGEYDLASVALSNQNREQVELRRFPAVDQYQLQCEAFVEEVRQNTGSVFSLEESKHNQQFIDACFTSAKSGETALL